VTQYSHSAIQSVKEATDLSALAGQYVKLRRVGQKLVGLCPFHKEQTPSFTVDPKNFFFCFGCGAKGDSINFLQLVENMTFPEAAQYLADKAGVSLAPGHIVDKRAALRARTLAERIAREAAWWWREHSRVASDSEREWIDATAPGRLVDIYKTYYRTYRTRRDYDNYVWLKETLRAMYMVEPEKTTELIIKILDTSPPESVTVIPL